MSFQRSSQRMVLIIPLWLAGCATAPLPIPTAPAAVDPFRTTTAGDTTVVAFTPPTSQCCPDQTLPQYLGITQCVDYTRTGCGQVLSCFGFLFPGLGAALQPGPPLLPITDPANLSPDAPPAVQTAAKIKAEEDAAAQKIQALRYLATIGCAGCYPGVDDAFIAAMDDCTEEVRYEAILAIRKTTSCPCKCCDKQACCSEKIQKKLRDIAYGVDDTGCPKESSDRVRRQARLALEQCGPAMVVEPAPEPEPEGPAEGPSEGPSEDANGAPGEGPTGEDEEATDTPTNGGDAPANGEESVPDNADSTAAADRPPSPQRLPAILPTSSRAASTSQLRLLGPTERRSTDSPPAITR